MQRSTGLSVRSRCRASSGTSQKEEGIAMIPSIVEIFDKHAAEYNFPALDNSYFHLADARLSAFCSTEDWAVTFELVGWAENELAFVCDVYAFGSCVRPEGLQSFGRIVANSVP